MQLKQNKVVERKKRENKVSVLIIYRKFRSFKSLASLV